jgi:hypothetical protein
MITIIDAYLFAGLMCVVGIGIGLAIGNVAGRK